MALIKVKSRGTDNVSGRRNLLINGAMQVAQRGTSSTGQGASDIFLLDRFKLNTNGNSAGRYTVTQTADGPSGFANCMKLDCTTADTSIAAAERFFIEQKLEGQDLQQIKKGTSDAEKITVSFYVKGNASATYVLGLYESDNSRQVGAQFSVTTSWTRVVVSFPADTTGALDDDNAESLSLRWYLHVGSNYTSGTLATTWSSASGATQVGSGTTSFFDSTNRTFFITGVQMEVGDQATDFEHRSFGEELSLCQRYYEKGMPQATLPQNNNSYNGVIYTNLQSGYGTWHTYQFSTPKRANPTMTLFNPGSGTANKAVNVAATSNVFTTSILYGAEYGFLSAIYGGTPDSNGIKVGFSWQAEAEL